MRTVLAVLLLVGPLALSTSCSEGTGPDEICISVSGQDITIHGIYASGGSYTVHHDIGVTGFTVTFSDATESHTLVFTNVVYNSQEVTSFNVNVDGTDYSYPADRC